MKFTRGSSKMDKVITYASEDGFYKISKRPSENAWVVREYSLFNILGDEIARCSSLEEAIALFN